MKKIYFFLLAICLMGAACKKNEEPPGGNTNEKEKSLKDTKWKLAGIVNVETGVLTELEPTDCEWCYYLIFTEDSIARGYALNNFVHVDLSKEGRLISTLIRVLGNPFCEATALVTSYSYNENELKFFYKENEVEHYLLYAIVKAENPPPLAHTKWKLAGIMDEGTGILRELKPKNCADCYTLTFDTDFIVIAKSVTMTVTLNLSLLPFSTFQSDDLICEGYDGEPYCDSNDFYKGVQTIESYTATSDELKLFITTYGKAKYFLFNSFNLSE